MKHRLVDQEKRDQTERAKRKQIGEPGTDKAISSREQEPKIAMLKKPSPLGKTQAGDSGASEATASRRQRPGKADANKAIASQQQNRTTAEKTDASPET